MAITTIEGLGGTVSFPTGFNGKLSAWSATFTVETTETTGFADGGYRVLEPVKQYIDGSASGTAQYDGASAAPVPASLMDGSGLALGDWSSVKGTVTLTATTGCTWAFSAVITSVAINRAADGKADITFNFQSRGPITQTWDET